MSPSYEATDWNHILSLYDMLLKLDPSPIAALNRAVAVSMVEGPEAALNTIDRIKNHPALNRYYLLHATRAALYTQLGNYDAARECYHAALELASTEPVRRFVSSKLTQVTEKATLA